MRQEVMILPVYEIRKVLLKYFIMRGRISVWQEKRIISLNRTRTLKSKLCLLEVQRNIKRVCVWVGGGGGRRGGLYHWDMRSLLCI